MPRIIFKCPHIKGGTEKAASHLANMVEYIATREGVTELEPAAGFTIKQPATQEFYIKGGENKTITFLV